MKSNHPLQVFLLQGPASSHKGLGEHRVKEAIEYLSPTCSYSNEAQQQAHITPLHSFNEAVSAHLAALTILCKYQDYGSFGFVVILTSTDEVSKFLLCIFPCFQLLCSAFLPWNSNSSRPQPPEKNASLHGCSDRAFLSSEEAVSLIRFPELLPPAELLPTTSPISVSQVCQSLLLRTSPICTPLLAFLTPGTWDLTIPWS